MKFTKVTLKEGAFDKIQGTESFLIKALPAAQKASDVNDRDPACYNHLEGIFTSAWERERETTPTQGRGEISTAPDRGS